MFRIPTSGGHATFIAVDNNEGLLVDLKARTEAVTDSSYYMGICRRI
jgi:hypothetical protein